VVRYVVWNKTPCDLAVVDILLLGVR